MSNQVNIVTCEFHNVIGDQKTGEVTKGYRMYDSYGMTYGNTWDSIPADDMEVLRMVLKEADETAETMFDHIRERKTGISINGNWLGWDRIKGLLSLDSDEQGTYADPEWEKGGTALEVP